MQTKESSEITDVLEENPALVIMWAGYGFSKDYNAPRGHFYILEDNINTLRTGAPVDMKTGPMPTACWACKSPDVPRLIDKMGETDFFTGTWARHGGEIVNSVGCADCHDNETMELTVTRDWLKRGLDAEGSRPFAEATHQDMRTLVCAQCHAEYYFKATQWTDANGEEQVAKVVTYPWSEGTAAEDIEKYYDDRDFVDWTHKLSRTPMLKAQHPGYETFITGVHGKNGLACADCHMPYVREGGVKYSNHKVQSPLEDIANTCLNCHSGTEDEFTATVERKLERKEELHQDRHERARQGPSRSGQGLGARCDGSGDGAHPAGHPPRPVALGLLDRRPRVVLPCAGGDAAGARQRHQQGTGCPRQAAHRACQVRRRRF